MGKGMRVGINTACLALLLCPHAEVDAGLDTSIASSRAAFVGSTSSLALRPQRAAASCHQSLPEMSTLGGMGLSSAAGRLKSRLPPAVSRLSMEEDWEPEVLVPERVLQVKTDNGFRELLSYADQCHAVVCIEFRQEFCRKCMAIAPKFRKLPAVYGARGVMFAEVDAVKISPALRAELGLKVVPKFEIRRDGQLLGEYIAGKNIGMVMHDVIDMIEEHVPADEFIWPGSGAHSDSLKQLFGETKEVSESTVEAAIAKRKSPSSKESQSAVAEHSGEKRSEQIPVHETPIEIEELFEDVAGRAFNDAMLYTEDVAARFFEEQEWLEQLAAQKDPAHLGNSISELNKQLQNLETKAGESTTMPNVPSESNGQATKDNGVPQQQTNGVTNGVRATSGQLSNGKQSGGPSKQGHGGSSADDLRAQLEALRKD